MTAAVAPDLEAARARISASMDAKLADHAERLSWSDERRAAHQTGRLRALLARALEASPFHARRLAGVDPAAFELADLASLPTMSKAQMMESFDELVTDRRVTRARVEEHLAATAATGEAGLLLGEYVCLASGGSSGTRGVFVQTAEEYADFGASIVRRVMARLAALGGPPPGGLTLAMVAAAAPVHSTAFGAATAQGPVKLVSIPSTLPIAEIVERLNALQPPAVQGYPSKLVRLAAEQRAGRLRIAPFSITATSEMSTPEERARISEAFAAPVVDQFASTEGLVGHSEPGGDMLVFADDMCLVEIASPDTVLVTNLHNLTQPLIRYELTDRFVAVPGEGPLRATVEGRADEAFRYGDLEVAPFAVRTVLVREAAVVEAQVRQTGRGADVVVVRVGPLDLDALAADLRGALTGAGLDAPEVTVREVEAIARHPETGKVRRFVPLPDARG
jgi:phenylacetate-coenzyme A ligase PaaK-like adenylate-forming protein